MISDSEALALGRMILEMAIQEQAFCVRLGDHKRDIICFTDDDNKEIARWRKENRSTSLNQ